MNTKRTTGQFEVVPTKTREAWERIMRGGGSSDDLEQVLEFLANVWQFDIADPRGFQRWLLLQEGVEAHKLTPLQVSDRKRLYMLDQEARVAPTKELVIALVNGVHAAAFFAEIGRFSGEFRILAYQIAVSAYETEGIVYALLALSQEAQWIRDSVSKQFSSRPVLRAYKAFTLAKSAHVCLGLRDETQPVPCETPIAVDQLFCLATNSPSEIAKQLETLGKARESILVESAGNLLSTLPDRSFGQFAKVNLSLFICSAASSDELFETGKNILLSTGEPNVADFLARLGEEYVRSELARVNRTFQPGQERMVAALIDAWRRMCGDSYRKFEEATRSIKIKAPPIALAISASAASKSEQHEARFQRVLTKALQNVKDSAAREWLIRNPEFINHLPVGRASLQTVKAIFDAVRSTPSQALSVSAQVLDQLRETTPLEYWEEALRTLAGVASTESENIFIHFVSERLHAGEGSYIRDLLTREPGATLLRRSFLSLLNTLEDRYWGALVEFLLVRSPESTILQLIESAFSQGGTVADWVVGSLLPDLLERQVLAADFVRRIRSEEMAAAVSKQLAARVAADIEELRSFAAVWFQRRTEHKKRLLGRITTGVHIAMNAAVAETRLHGQLSKLLMVVRELEISSPPALDPVVSALASTETPPPIPDEDALRRIFAHNPPAPLQLALMVANNAGIIDTAFKERGPWPKMELLHFQIAERFVNVSQVRRRARQHLETIADDVRSEVAIALRDLLSDIETELAGYFAFRDILDQSGIHAVSDKLGLLIGERELSSERHKVIRDPSARGRLRVFSLGVAVSDRVIGGSVVMNSGGDDDRD